MEQQYDFATSEHLGGQHKTWTPNCYECAKEAKIIRAKRTVDLGTSIHSWKIEDMRLDPNPLD